MNTSSEGMQEEDKRRMKRVTVTLDCDTVKILEDMANEENRSVSEIVRFAINYYYKNKKSYGELKPEILNIISELLFMLTESKAVASG